MLCTHCSRKKQQSVAVDWLPETRSLAPVVLLSYQCITRSPPPSQSEIYMPLTASSSSWPRARRVLRRNETTGMPVVLCRRSCCYIRWVCIINGGQGALCFKLLFERSEFLIYFPYAGSWHAAGRRQLARSWPPAAGTQLARRLFLIVMYQ